MYHNPQAVKSMKGLKQLVLLVEMADLLHHSQDITSGNTSFYLFIENKKNPESNKSLLQIIFVS